MNSADNKSSAFSKLRIVIWTAIGAGMLILSYLVWLLPPDLSDPDYTFNQRKGTLKSIEIESEWQQGGSVFRHVTLQSSTGLKVKMTTQFPEAHSPRAYPLVVILGGERTGRDALHQVTLHLPIVFAAISYPHRDDWVEQGPGYYDVRMYQQTALDTTPAVLLALDYLLAQDSVDKLQVELVGVSLGAFFVSMPAALEPRVSRTWLVHGAGEPEKVIAYMLREQIRTTWLRRLVAWTGARLLAVESLRPENWLPRISPRKLVFINARDDESMPLASVLALHRSAAQPYEVIWTDGEHVDTGRTEVIDQLVGLIAGRVLMSR